jgi:alanyl-tRNA synthetase
VTSSQIREKFLAYFEEHKHKRIKSASLIPVSDPTLYFTNAGMVQFKNIFTGAERPPASCAASSQKCMRVSGKHNDLENVGRTARHHTFFEMLGNFSFGDYFKKEAIRFGWEFLTQEMGLPQDKLWVTVYEDDDEAKELWMSEVGVPADRILKFGKDENYWSMGDTGPCGPCSEIHYDHGEEFSCGKPTCQVNCDCDRYMEIWNLVFMQYDRDDQGNLTDLPKPSIDTGMGLERLAAVAQGKHSNYESDLFSPLFKAIEQETGRKYKSGGRQRQSAGTLEPRRGDGDTKMSMQVLADHIRAATFLIADGIQPSNEGRGYVLRRIMRRAIRHGKLLGMKQPFFYKLADTVIQEMSPVYPELKKHRKLISKLIKGEEEKFLETLEKGLSIIAGKIKEIKKSKGKSLHGDVVFQLYDTYGFPVDLTQVIVEGEGLGVDMAGFEKNMEAQKGRGRKAWKGAALAESQQAYDTLAKAGQSSEFLGYQDLEETAPITAILVKGKQVKAMKAGDVGEVITSKTPFYPEGGGQVGDHGQLTAPKGCGDVLDTHKTAHGLIIHAVQLNEGLLKVGDVVHLQVDPHWRRHVQAHHSATHVIHAALRQVLGDHIRQAGSLVEPDRLRFDFSHFESVSDQQLKEIEDISNEAIRTNYTVTKETLPYDEAMKKGALAFFEEKYGDEVRVIKMGDYSCELCGGTHVEATGEIGLVKLLHESSVAAGVRRVEAVVGEAGFNYLRDIDEGQKSLAASLKTSPGELKGRITKLQDHVKKLERELVTAQKKAAMEGGSGDLKVAEINGVRALIQRVDGVDMKTFRELSDQALQKVKSGIVILGNVADGKVSLIVRVSKDLTKTHHALVGGKGGGRPDMAQAGGQDTQGLEAALKKAKELI